MLKHNKEYRQLLARRDLLKLVFDIRCLDIIRENRDHTSLNAGSASSILLEEMNLEKRLQHILNDLEDGILNLNATPEDEVELYRSISRLYAERDSVQMLRKTENETHKLELACPNLTSPCLEFMRFVESLDEETKNLLGIKRTIGKILSILPYESAKEEREYLTEVSAEPEWYSAFFFDNASVGSEELNEAFCDLLSSTFQNGKNGRQKLLDKAIFEYSKRRVTISKTMTKNLILASLNAGNFEAKTILGSIGKSSLKLPKDAEKILKKVLRQLQGEDDSISRIKIIQLFIIFSNLYQMNRTIEVFARVMSEFPQGEILADHIESYLSSVELRAEAERFTERYLMLEDAFQKNMPFLIQKIDLNPQI